MSPDLNITPRSELQAAIDRLEQFERDERGLTQPQAVDVLRDRASDLLNAVDHALYRLLHDHACPLTASAFRDSVQDMRGWLVDELESEAKAVSEASREHEPREAAE